MELYYINCDGEHRGNKMNLICIEYETSVFTPAGWRGVTIRAEAVPTSAKMATVCRVVVIDGEAPLGYTTRTGAKRQRYNARGIAQREIGARKRLSSCVLC
jgi:hypothetical protein